jgi:hypothetical protein
MAARNGKTATTPRQRAKASRKRSKGPKPPVDLQAAGIATWTLLHDELPHIIFPGDEPLALRLCRVEDEMASLRSHLLEHGTILMRPVQTASGKRIGGEPVVHPAMLAIHAIYSRPACGVSSIGSPNPPSRTPAPHPLTRTTGAGPDRGPAPLLADLPAR